jgi:hypothetical protein
VINIVLACSDTDEELGLYFSVCAKDLKKYLESQNTAYELHEINGNRLNGVYLGIVIERLQPDKFIFTAYSHGKKDALIHNKTSYVEVGHNTHLYKNSLFCAIACSAGQELGKHLVDTGVSAFCGYNDDVFAVQNFYDIFCACDNCGIKAFLQGEKLATSVDRMKEKYTEKIDEVYGYNIMAANYLRRNRDALVLWGNGDLLLTDFQ